MSRTFKLASMLMAVACVFAVTASSASATFTSANYPATGSGGTTADVIDAFGSTAKCTHNTFAVHEIKAATTTLRITPTYTGCTAFGAPMTVNTTGCDVLAHNGSGKATIAVDMVCPEGVKGIDMTVYTASNHATVACHAVLLPFTGKEGLTASNNGNHVLVQGKLEGLTVTQARTNVVLCPPGTETKEGRYTTQAAGATVVGSNGAISLS